jgi:hypothetical protein
MLGMVRPLRVFEQDSGLKAGPVFLSDPREFEFSFIGHCIEIQAHSAGREMV